MHGIRRNWLFLLAAATLAFWAAPANAVVLSVPDFIANAGGVIMAAMEYADKSAEEAFTAIDGRIAKNTALILDRAAAEGIIPRQAAVTIARERVLRAMEYREV